MQMFQYHLSQLEKFIFIEYSKNAGGTELVFRNNYRPLAKDHYLEIVSCFSKTKKTF